MGKDIETMVAQVNTEDYFKETQDMEVDEREREKMAKQKQQKSKKIN